MAQNEVDPAEVAAGPEARISEAPLLAGEDVGSRAAERFADLYAETEHEGRATRYDKAISQALDR